MPLAEQQGQRLMAAEVSPNFCDDVYQLFNVSFRVARGATTMESGTVGPCAWPSACWKPLRKQKKPPPAMEPAAVVQRWKRSMLKSE